MISLIRKIRHIYLLKFKWRKYTFGADPYIGRSVYMWAKHSIVVGNNFYIGKYSQIECDAVIGDNVMLANRVALIGGHDHEFQCIGLPIRLSPRIRDDDYSGKGRFQKIVIEDDVWIGYGSIVLSGVTIGQGSIIGAGSVVTRNVDPHSIYAGNPARKIKSRFLNDQDLDEHLRLYNLNYKK